MESKDEVKANILKKVNKKLKKRNLIIASVSILGCVVIGITAFSIFWANKPLPTPEEVQKTYVEIAQGEQTPIGVDFFSNASEAIRAYTKMETINELDSRELKYNHVFIPLKESMFGTLEVNGHFYAENHSDGTASLYFYLGETEAQKAYKGIYYTDVLMTPPLCNIKETINEITKIYYLVYDYENLSQSDFDQAKLGATLLWEK